MSTPRAGSRAEQRRRTEARILNATTQVFFSAGYDRTTIRAVASAAEVDAGADPAQVIRLLRPCVLSLAARPDHSGPP